MRGELKADKQEGHGTERYASGAVYEGQWKEGRREGRGTYRWADGDVGGGLLQGGTNLWAKV